MKIKSLILKKQYPLLFCLFFDFIFSTYYMGISFGI